MKNRFAILVMHGIGDQKPFETMDAFLRCFVPAWQAEINKRQPGAVFETRHELRQFPHWVESLVSLQTPGTDAPVVDVYEYYWAHMAERKITAGEVGNWMVDVARGACRYYERQKDKSMERGVNDELFSADGEFKQYKYLARMLSLGRFLKLAGRMLAVFLYKFPWVRVVVEAVSRLPGLKNLAGDPLQKYLGDVALYCSTDKKSAYYETRARILAGAVDKLKYILRTGEYDGVLVAGHSLGSVVAYDALARLNREMNTNAEVGAIGKKVMGLVTFGSPLDKIAFFFDEQIRKEEVYRSAIVAQLYGFRRVNVDASALTPAMTQYFDDLKWLNFWCPKDPVSGHLDVYRGVENIEMDFSGTVKDGIRSGLESHGAYWCSDVMFGRVIRDFGLAGAREPAGAKSLSAAPL